MTSLGQWLRQEREARSISLEEIASGTKIVSRYLEALESDRLDLMPGGFFIKGIIRAYARAVGLDPEQVLGRYREAGLLAPAEPARDSFAKPAPAPPAPPEYVPTIAPSPEAEPPARAAADESERPASSLVFEEAAPPEPPATGRGRILAWAWRGLAGLLVLGTVLVLWSPWRRQAAAPPQSATAAAVTERPLAQKTEPSPGPIAAPSPSGPGAGQAAETGREPAAVLGPEAKAGGAAPPAVEEAWKGVTIEIVFQAETWIQIYTDGELQVDGLFPAGATARAQAAERLLIHTGNAGGFTFRLNGRPAKPLGRSGQVLTDIKITPANLNDFLEAPPPGLPPG